jgi:hypothetical protein
MSQAYLEKESREMNNWVNDFFKQKHVARRLIPQTHITDPQMTMTYDLRPTKLCDYTILFKTTAAPGYHKPFERYTTAETVESSNVPSMQIINKYQMQSFLQRCIIETRRHAPVTQREKLWIALDRLATIAGNLTPRATAGPSAFCMSRS